MKVAVIRTDNFNILKSALVSCCSVLNMGTCSWHSNTERGPAEVNWFATKNKPSLGGKQKWVTLGSRRCFYLFCTAAAVKVANLSHPEPARSEVKTLTRWGSDPLGVCVLLNRLPHHTHTLTTCTSGACAFDTAYISLLSTASLCLSSLACQIACWRKRWLSPGFFFFSFFKSQTKKNPQVVCPCLSDRCPRPGVCVCVCVCVCVVCVCVCVSGQTTDPANPVRPRGQAVWLGNWPLTEQDHSGGTAYWTTVREREREREEVEA